MSGVNNCTASQMVSNPKFRKTSRECCAVRCNMVCFTSAGERSVAGLCSEEGPELAASSSASSERLHTHMD